MSLDLAERLKLACEESLERLCEKDPAEAIPYLRSALVELADVATARAHLEALDLIIAVAGVIAGHVKVREQGQAIRAIFRDAVNLRFRTLSGQ